MEKRHKIVLYNPKTVFFDMPLALLALASCFDKSKFELVIIDGRMEKDAHQRVLNETEGALCFGVTVLTGNPIQDAIKITRKVKQQRPEIRTIWGGWHTSLFPTETLEDEPSVDISVQGQGELTFQEIVNSFFNSTSLADIRGICYRNGDGEIMKNPPRPMEKMVDLPAADYSLIDVEAYFKKKKKRQLDYISSVGCLYRCAFCADPFVFKRKFSAINAERMAEEIETLQNQYAFTNVNFQDETFFTYNDRIMKFAGELTKRKINISWAATMRADQGDRLSNEDFKLLSQSGLRRVLVGVESGSQEMMNRLKKDITKPQVLATAMKCMDNNISVQFPFIVGFPGESEESFEQSLDFAIELANMSDKFEIAIFYFKPYPGSDLTREEVKNGFPLPASLQEWAEFDFLDSSSPWLSEKQYKKIQVLKFYLRIARSQHSILFALKYIAKQRLRHKWFGFPVGKWVFEIIRPTNKLS